MRKNALGGFIFLLFVGLLVFFFWRSEEPNSPAQALQPGDVNYPVVNPAPEQVVKFTAIIPDGWPAEFRLLYMVTVDQQNKSKKLISPPGCAWKQNKQFYVDVPLLLQRQDKVYKGDFTVDYFLPGACQWSMYNINSPVLRSALVFRIHSSHPNSQPGLGLDLTKQKLHIWCTKHGKGLKKSAALNEQYDCTPFGMVELFTDLPVGFKETVPEEQRDWPNTFSQYLREMSVEIHDLDQLIPEYLSRASGKPGSN